MKLTPSDDSRYYHFLETPIAELEQYGVDYATIESIENAFGIYVRDLLGITPEELRERANNFGELRLARLQAALQTYWMELHRNGHGSNGSSGV